MISTIDCVDSANKILCPAHDWSSSGPRGATHKHNEKMWPWWSLWKFLDDIFS